MSQELGAPRVPPRPPGFLAAWLMLPQVRCELWDYLNSGLSEVDSARKVFPYEGIGVVCPLKDPL